jgi:uncharacterized membrane protein YebE (DUF533 family)
MDFSKVIDGLNRSGFSSGLLGGALGGAVSGAMVSKKGRKHLGTALKVGGLAALGGMAWKAYQGYRESPAPREPVGEGGPSRAPLGDTGQWEELQARRFLLEEQVDEGAARSRVLVSAMIAAAYADGHIDAQEQRRILARAAELQLDAEEKALVLQELQNPGSLQDVVQSITDPELATEVYLVSLLAIDQASPTGEAYLNALAFMLSLPPGLEARLREEVNGGEVARSALSQEESASAVQPAFQLSSGR